MNLEVLPHGFGKLQPPKLFKKSAGAFLSSRETFFCRNFKYARMSFLGRCNVETAMKQMFKFLQKKVSQHDKIIFLHLLNESRGFVTWFWQITTPKSVNLLIRPWITPKCYNSWDTNFTFFALSISSGLDFRPTTFSRL